MKKWTKQNNEKEPSKNHDSPQPVEKVTSSPPFSTLPDGPETIPVEEPEPPIPMDIEKPFGSLPAGPEIVPIEEPANDLGICMDVYADNEKKTTGLEEESNEEIDSVVED
eukprot:CAMPEP_0185739430 /NCGR_PEP_ID=MMETSP1171-20130828/35437_1 /TAXON_ID=374046 /ORGANISM="Helicotheca tamensis, Strain CCMP826" /LENGTH=109 /DNA_ID=CAMNT_0028410999 /DNA_START=105 /DNA_END=431 /DNA_ORIENTATION=+